jgi:hypothetical protein
MRRNNKIRTPLPFRKSHIEYVPSGKYHTKMVTKIEGEAEKGSNREVIRKAKFAKRRSSKPLMKEPAGKAKRARKQLNQYLKGKKNWAKKAE